MPPLIEYLRAFGRFQRNARLYLISNALSGVTVGIILVLYNLYLTALGYGPDFVGLVLFAGTLGAGAAIFPAGLCVDRFSGRRILIWASVEIGIAGAGQFLFHQPLPLLVSAFAAGVGGAFILVVNAPFLTASSQPAERPHLFSLNIVVTLAATVLGEVTGGALPIWLRGNAWLMGAAPSWLAWALVHQPQARSYQLALLLAGCIAAPSFVPLFMMSDERPAQFSIPRSESEFNVSYASSMAGLRSAVARAILRLRKTRWHAVVVSPLFVMVAVQALTGMGAGLFLPYFNIYFVKHLGASSALFGLIDGGANALNAVLTLAAPWLAARIGKVNSIVATRAASIPLCARAWRIWSRASYRFSRWRLCPASGAG